MRVHTTGNPIRIFAVECSTSVERESAKAGKRRMLLQEGLRIPMCFLQEVLGVTCEHQ